MAIKKFKPTSHGRRGMTQVIREVDKIKPEKLLIVKINRKFGRANGTISIRHKGAGHKRSYRLIDIKQKKIGVPGYVASIEYDPNRSANIALIKYRDGGKVYIIAPNGLKKGDEILSGEKAKVSPGNRKRLSDVPSGTVVYNIEINPGAGGKLVRSAGTSAKILGKEGKFATIEMPSKEVRRINKECYATIGTVSNPEHKNVVIGKAGRNRWKGIRPTVRGKAMHPAAHPHGGGEGVSDIGLIHPKTPWGKPALGFRTRKNKRTDKFIVKRRKK
jgi:large subunit ribosomal protein L2